MNYNDLFIFWMKERTNSILQKIPTDFYILIDGILAKLYQTSQESEWDELSEQIIQRMEFLRKDIAQLRLAKILDLIIHEGPFNEEVLTWDEQRLVKDLQRSIAMLGILKPPELDSQITTSFENNIEEIETSLVHNEEITNKEFVSLENFLIRIMTDLDSFIGLDNKEYGPFLANDIVNLPAENAKALISKGLAKMIEVDLNNVLYKNNS